eukprot:1013228-Rhodomonas_salina.1
MVARHMCESSALAAAHHVQYQRITCYARSSIARPVAAYSGAGMVLPGKDNSPTNSNEDSNGSNGSQRKDNGTQR